MSGIHLAALYPTSAAAVAAQHGLIAAGVDAGRVLLLDRSHPETEAHARAPARLWGLLKHAVVPDPHAHAYAEGITRGHPLVIADVTEAGQAAALQALQAAGPIDIDQHIDTWRAEGWNGIYPGADDWYDVTGADRAAAGSEGIVAGGLLAGDYGAVGGMIGGGADTDILRGKSFLGGHGRTAVPVEGGENVQVFEVR
jgi:hypothetical protein